MMLLLAAEVFAYHMSQDSSQSALQEKDDALQETRNELLGVRQLLEKERSAAAANRTAEEQAAAERAQAEEEARERRIAHIAQTFARRLLRAGLARGWTTWAEQYEHAMYQKRLLASVVARFTKPKLSACVAHWRHEWEAEQMAALRRGQELLRAEKVRVVCPAPSFGVVSVLAGGDEAGR